MGAPLIAEIVSVGTEILLGQITDSNAQLLGTVLPEYGIAHHHRQTVGDNLTRLTEALNLALSRSDIVFTIGGLGPTEDDLTRDGVAAALGLRMILDEEVAERLRKMFALRNLPWLDTQLRQAQKPQGARVLDNPNGSAPGLYVQFGGKHVFLLPGPRGEFGPMVQGPVREILMRLAGNEVIHSKILKVVGLGESIVEERLRGHLASLNPSLAPYAKLGEVHLRLTAKAADVAAALRLIEPLETAIRAELGEAVFGSDEDTLESSIVELLKPHWQTLSTAESITGGGVSARITGVPGASAVYKGSVVSYQLSVKRELLGVTTENDPVAEETAREMAEGARKLLGTTFALATTGNAGPTADGANLEGNPGRVWGQVVKPVGLVYVAVAGPMGTEVQEFKYRGTRADIRRRTEQAALTLLRKVILANGSRS